MKDTLPQYHVYDKYSVYALGKFEDPLNPSTLKGGTGWVVQMTFELVKTFANPQAKSIFVFEMYHKAWFKAIPTWQPESVTPISPFAFKRFYGLPLLDISSALVGSRGIAEITKREIVALFEKITNNVRQHREQVQLLNNKIREKCICSYLIQMAKW